jgi:DNA-binding transcriptional LysR family regulator
MLKLSKLEVFSVVTQEGSFSAAAERLHLSQPAISRHMQELEAALGIRLFKRLRRGVALTPGGEILSEYTEKILWLVREAEGELTDVRQLTMGQVHIGATPGVSVYLLPGWTRSFTSTYPNLTVSLSTDTTGGVIECLLSGRIDLGIVEGELEALQREDLESIVLQDFELVLVVGKDHPWAANDSIAADALREHRFVTREPGSRTRVWIDEMLGKRNIEPHLIAEFDNPEAIKEAVMDNVGVTILPTYAVARERKAGLVHTLRVDDLDMHRQLKLLWDSARPFSPMTRAFLSHLSESFETIKPIIPPTAAGVFGDED